MKLTENISLQELISKEHYESQGELAIRAINKRAPRAIQFIRNEYGPVKINDWLWGGEFNESGVRLSHHKYYRPYSDHSFGNAFDLKFSESNFKDVIKDIKNSPEVYIPLGITGLEINTDGWVHVSFANYNAKGIVLFDANKHGAIANWEVFH